MTAAAALILLAASAQLSTGQLLFGLQHSQLPQRHSQLAQLPPFRPQPEQLPEPQLQLVTDNTDWSESQRQLGGPESDLGPDPAEYVAETERLVPVSVAFTDNKRKRKPAGRRSGPSLSIVNPLQVLRQRLMLEIVRRRMRQKQTQITANSEILQELGKRSVRRMEKRQKQEYLETSRANLDR